ncbi:MAG: DNA-binding protein [Desulfurococcales archaeon]|nr:DNA-binding protein [Desulfurococcales archaeon]
MEHAAEEPVYLMSLKPRYARLIFAGVKKYELRRLSGVPPVEEGGRIVVYVSGNVQAIVGEFRAGSIIRGAPEYVWARVRRPGTGIGEDAWQYIRGARRAMAIEVVGPTLYPRPVTLEELRRIIPGWMPPFSYKRLSEGDPLLELVLRRIWEAGLHQRPGDGRIRGGRLL